MTTLSLYTLPTELIHYLLEYVDFRTIFFSFRYVCKRFYAIIDKYNRYELDLRSVSKRDFDMFCSKVDARKIQSLVLSDDLNTPHEIRLFLSRFSLDQYERMENLKLVKVQENQLFPILMQISSSSIRRLSMEIYSWKTFSYTIRVLLASVIARSKLETLELNLSFKNLEATTWFPLPISLKSLRLERCTLQEYCLILHQCSNLKHFVLRECILYKTDGSLYQPMEKYLSLSLTSFYFGPCFMRMKELLHFLCFTPRLKQLKLIVWTDSTDSVIDGRRWEDFISKTLVDLRDFQFFFDDLTCVDADSFDIQSYLTSFRTPFWLEKNHWYIVCDYIQTLSIVRLYSLPICNSSLTFYTSAERISASTLPDCHSISSFWTDQVREINVSLIENSEKSFGSSSSSSIDIRFNRVDRLSITVDGRYSSAIVSTLPRIVNFSCVNRLSVQILVFDSVDDVSVISHLEFLFKQTKNLDFLKLIYPLKTSISFERISSIIPHSIKHLEISVSKLEQAKQILSELQQISSITFHSLNISNYSEDLQKWIDSKRRNSIYRDGIQSLQIWLGPLIEGDLEKLSMKRVLQRLRAKATI